MPLLNDSPSQGGYKKFRRDRPYIPGALPTTPDVRFFPFGPPTPPAWWRRQHHRPRNPAVVATNPVPAAYEPTDLHAALILHFLAQLVANHAPAQ